MAVFAILNRNASPELTPAVQREFAVDHYIWSSGILFIRASGTAREVSARLGIKSVGDGGVVKGSIDQSVVIEVSPNYWGFTDQALWTWLVSSFEKTS